MKNQNNRSIAETLKHGREMLMQKGVDGYQLDALVLLSFVLGKPKEWLFSHDYELSDTEYQKYTGYIEKRAKGTPVQYITRRQEFMGIEFYVDENVLIPRNDTEILVERLIEVAKGIKKPRILDMCTGSGCIAVSAAYYNREAMVTAIDISPEAIAIAERNAEAANVSSQIDFFAGDLFEPFGLNTEPFDIIVSNPPYITNDEMAALPSEVTREPHLALSGGESGLDFYMKISEGSLKHLKNNGLLLFEIGAKQAQSVIEIMNKLGYNNINIYNDLAGLNRVAEGVWNVRQA